MTLSSNETNCKSTVGTKRTRGRSARVRQAALAAALEEITNFGFIAFSVSRVAKSAGVHETTLYRRWPKKEDLIVEACMEFTDEALPVPNRGSLKEDLRVAISNIAKVLETKEGSSLVRLAISSSEIPEFKKLSEKVWKQRIEIGQQVFDAAIERGEWDISFDRNEAFALIFGPLLAHRLILNCEISGSIIDSIIDSVLLMADH